MAGFEAGKATGIPDMASDMAQTEDLQVLVTFAEDGDCTEPMGPTAFTRFFADRLRMEKPDAVVTIVDDLHLQFEDGPGDKVTLGLDNAFKRYLQSPEELEEVVALYLRTMLTAPEAWDAQLTDENLRPVLRGKAFLEEMTEVLTQDQDDPASAEPLSDRVNDEISVLYVFDTAESMRYAQVRDLETLSVDRGGLFGRAVANFRASLPEVQVEKSMGYFIPMAGGDYESSLLFLSEFWTKDRFPVKGDIVVFPLSRDMLLVTGSEERKGLARAAKSAARAGAVLDYFITDKPFVWKQGRWLPFKPPPRRSLFSFRR